MDTLVSMRIFVTVVEAGSFTLAADRFHISRPMVSKHVAHLEEHLGTRLLNRTTRRLVLTESGKDYYARCLSILNDINEAENSAANLTYSPQGMLRVSMPVSFSVRHMGATLAAYIKKFPNIHIDVSLSDHRTNLVDEGLDLAIRIGPTQEPGLVSCLLANDEIVICGAPAYLARQGEPHHPIDLQNYNCLLYTHSVAGNEWQLRGADGVHTIKVSGDISANNGDLLNEIVLNGQGLIRMPLFIVGDDIKTGRLVRVLSDYTFDPISIYAVYPTKKHLSAKIRTFIEFLGERKDLWLNW